jgi:phosphatidylinositol alpha-mannosyltransferase
MRIGLVCPYSLDVAGGVQNHVCELAEALTGLGHDASVLAPAAREMVLPPYVVPAGRAVAVPYNGSVARLSFGPRSLARVRRWLEAGRFDLLHVHEPTAPSLSLLAAWTADVPTVATFHTAMDGNRSRVMAAAGGVLRPGLQRIAARIAVSPQAEETMRLHLPGTARVIPNGLWVDRFSSTGTSPVYGAARTLLFLGRTDETRKGLDVLLAAAPALLSECPDLRLVVAGHGDADRVRDRIARSMSAECARRVVVHGSVDDVTRARLLAQADVYVAPHTGGESFGIVLAEAMAAGAAVAASDLPAFVSMLDGGRAGALFPTGDADALHDTVLSLLVDPVRRGGVVVRAARHVRRFDWSVVAKQVLDVYDEALPGPGVVASA